MEIISQRKPTALACFTDGVAISAMRAAYELRMRVPDELAVTGFGGLEITRSTVIPLTTVEQPFEKMGELAVSELLKTMKSKPDSPRYEVNNNKLPTSLKIRRSTIK